MYSKKATTIIDNTYITNKNNTIDTSKLNVYNYSIQELKKMIGIKNNNVHDDQDDDTNNFNEKTINNKCEILTKNILKSSLETTNKNDYNRFINEVKEYLIQCINHDKFGYNSSIENDLMNKNKNRDTIEENNNRTFANNKPIQTYNVIPRSKINPVYKETLTQLVSIDSVFRDRTDSIDSIQYFNSSSNFVYKFSNPLKNIISMKISTVELPFVWYLFNEANNQFTIETKNNPDGITSDTIHSITIPVGSYTNDVLIKYVNNIFMNIKNGLEYIIFGIEETTGKSFFRVKKQGYDDDNVAVNDPYKNNPTKPFIFTIYFYKDYEKQCEQVILKEYDSLGWLLGFRQPKYTVTKEHTLIDRFTFDTIHELPNYLKSEGAYGTSAPNYIFIDVDDFNNNFRSSGIICDNNEYISSNTLLGRISINAPANTMLFNTQSDKVFKTRDYFGPITINRLNLKLIDRFGNIINLQNNDWSISLEFTVIYQ